jgi:hypothetical protein
MSLCGGEGPRGGDIPGAKGSASFARTMSGPDVPGLCFPGINCASRATFFPLPYPLFSSWPNCSRLRAICNVCNTATGTFNYSPPADALNVREWKLSISKFSTANSRSLLRNFQACFIRASNQRYSTDPPNYLISLASPRLIYTRG